MSKLPSDSRPPTAIKVELPEVPQSADRRTFLMRSAVIGATAVITGRTVSAQQQNRAAAAAPAPAKLSTALSPTLDVVKKESRPVMTTIDEFYKVGPGPSSSHTIGPMRITYDFYQRCTKLPAATLAKATAFKVNLFGSLSATGLVEKSTAPAANCVCQPCRSLTVSPCSAISRRIASRPTKATSSPAACQAPPTKQPIEPAPTTTIFGLLSGKAQPRPR